MVADLPIDLWLETQQQGNRHVFIPYVRSIDAGPLRYQIALTRQGTAGTSRIRQGGEVDLIAGEALPLATLSAGSAPATKCEVSIILDAANHPPKSYRFDCP